MLLLIVKSCIQPLLEQSRLFYDIMHYYNRVSAILVDAGSDHPAWIFALEAVRPDGYIQPQVDFLLCSYSYSYSLYLVPVLQWDIYTRINV